MASFITPSATEDEIRQFMIQGPMCLYRTLKSKVNDITYSLVEEYELKCKQLENMCSTGVLKYISIGEYYNHSLRKDDNNNAWDLLFLKSLHESGICPKTPDPHGLVTELKINACFANCDSYKPYKLLTMEQLKFLTLNFNYIRYSVFNNSDLFKILIYCINPENIIWIPDNSPCFDLGVYLHLPQNKSVWSILKSLYKWYPEHLLKICDAFVRKNLMYEELHTLVKYFEVKENAIGKRKSEESIREQFEFNFNKLQSWVKIDDLKPIFVEYKDCLVLAGGSVVNSIVGLTVEFNTDLDFFLFGDNLTRCNEAMKSLQKVLLEKAAGKQIYWGFRGSLVYGWLENSTNVVQFIYKHYAYSVAELLNYFDLTYCQVGFSANEVVCTKYAFENMKQSNTFVNEFQIHRIRKARIEKAAKKGFLLDYRSSAEEKEVNLILESSKTSSIFDNDKQVSHYPKSSLSNEENLTILREQHRLFFIQCTRNNFSLSLENISTEEYI